MQAFSQAVVISVVHDETHADYDTLTLWDLGQTTFGQPRPLHPVTQAPTNT
jgi:hypothetical protein